MRSSNEFQAAIEAAGAECRFRSGGTSYRAGGDILVSPKGYWDSNVPVRVERMKDADCFDGTGYDGRGRHWQVWRVVPDPKGMVRVSEGQWTKLPEDQRFCIGGGSSKSQSEEWFWGRPEADSKVDVLGCLAGLLGAVTVQPVVVTRHPALISLLREWGLVNGDAKVLEHVSPEDIKGQHVIGVLPFYLAAMAQKVTEIPLTIPPELRGKELDLETLRAVAGKPVTYRVEIVP